MRRDHHAVRILAFILIQVIFVPSDPTMSAPLLEVNDLCFARQNERIFGPLSFTLEAGHVLSVEGDNGSGKSTLLRILTGLLRAESGTLQWQGQALSRMQMATNMAFVGHQLGIKADLSPLENLRLAVDLHGTKHDGNLRQTLDDVGLYGYEHEPVRRLSAGQKKRAALARLLHVPAQLWLLDEPFANLDGEGIRLVNTLLKDHLQQGGAAMVTSHGTVNYLAVEPRRIKMAVHAAATD